jgi:ankyrin repeat protein
MLIAAVSILAGIVIHSANDAAQQPTPRPSAQRTQKQEPNAERDFYCPSKKERGSFCPEGKSGVSKKRGCTPLMRAAERGNLEAVRALLKAGANVNRTLAHWGHTALMIAAGEGHLEVVKALLSAGADPNAVAFGHGGVPGWAWMFAMNRCNKNWQEMMDAMLAAGVEVNPKTGIYPSPLGYAIEQTDEVMIEALLKRGADVNLRDSDTGQTPLMFAAKYSSAEVVKALIAAGADVNAMNNEGKTALMIVEEYGENLWEKEIVLLLKRAGAKK